MNKKNLSANWGIVLTLTVGLLLYAQSASADWYVHGVQYSCSKNTESFTILPHDESSDAPQPPVKSGFKALPDGTSNLNCRLGERKLQARINVTPPQSHGMCMGAGYVSVSSLSVDGVELLTEDIPINWDCDRSKDPVVGIRVFNKTASVALEICSTKEVAYGGATSKPKCSTKSIDIDAVAGANAKLDHQLAAPQTQERDSAMNMSPENDLAKVFDVKYPEGSKIPLCAHWDSTFISSIVSPEHQRHGRIAGADGDRLYIHPTNPQLCQNANEEGCKAKAYVLAGDRVEVGFICGEWTQIQYPSRVRSRRATKGWVETARLYGLDPLKTAEAASSSPPSIEQSLKSDDPLVKAVRSRSIEDIKRLIKTGENPDGIDKSGTPLAAAVQADDVELVQTLLALKANPNAHPSTSNQKCITLHLSLEKRQVFDVLVKAGIDLNCRGGQFGSTQLMDVAWYNRLWAWERIHNGKQPSREKPLDPALLVKRLLEAGANPNTVDDVGRTALFYASEPNNLDVTKLLLRSGANPNIFIDKSTGESFAQQTGSTALMNAYDWYSLTFDTSMIKMLLANGANPDFKNTSAYNREWDETTSGAVTFAGQTLLTRAATDGYIDIVKILLINGADSTLPREDGSLPEEIAEEKGHHEVAEFIRRHTKH